jgi:hypothetical protein
VGAAAAAIVVKVTDLLVHLLCAPYGRKCPLPFLSQDFAVHILLMTTPYLTLHQLHSSLLKFHSSPLPFHMPVVVQRIRKLDGCPNEN